MKINNYMTQKLSKCDQEDLCEDVFQDAQLASDFGVESDHDYELYFHINHLADEILKDTFDLTLDNLQLQDLKKYVFGFKANPDYNLKNLVDIRILIYKWIVERGIKKETNKTAYNNISGICLPPSHLDVEKWKLLAKTIYNEIGALGISRDDSFKKHTSDLDKDESFKFNNWLKYYEQKTPEKYTVKTANIIKVAFGEDIVFPKEWMNPDSRMSASDDGKTKKERDLEKAKMFKTQMKSRIRSLKSLIDKYNDILPHQNIDKIFDEITSLEKGIGKLNVYASLQDRVIRSSTNFEKYGFKEGAALLKEAADIAPATLQSGPSSTTDMPEGQLKLDVHGVIDKMEGVSKVLKQRELVRELSKIDIMLSEIGMGSFFPEVTDALSKLIEGFSYSSNRIESVIAKLRGGGKSDGKSAIPKPSLPEPKLPTMPVKEPGIAVKPETQKLEPASLHDIPKSKVVEQAPVTAPVKPTKQPVKQ